MQQLLKKLTVKGIMGAKIDTLPPVADMIVGKKKITVSLCRIVGRTDRSKPDSSKMSDFVRFHGEFIGVNLLTGERFDSGSIILPGIAESAVYAQLSGLPKDDKGNANGVVEFAFEVGVKFDETAATKYVYTVNPLMEAKPSDPMKVLLDSTGTLKAIADKTAKKT